MIVRSSSEGGHSEFIFGGCGSEVRSMLTRACDVSSPWRVLFISGLGIGEPLSTLRYPLTQNTTHVPHVSSTVLPCVVGEPQPSAPRRPRRTHRLCHSGVSCDFSGWGNYRELVSCRQGLDVLASIVHWYDDGFLNQNRSSFMPTLRSAYFTFLPLFSWAPPDLKAAGVSNRALLMLASQVSTSRNLVQSDIAHVVAPVHLVIPIEF